jgi:hypothetical protein
MMEKPTVEQALLFKRLREQDWYGVRDHVIKECLEATNWDEAVAREYLDRNWIPPQPDHWCPRWSYLGGQRVPGDPLGGGPGVRWYLVSFAEVDGKKVVVPLDENLQPTNTTGRKMSEYFALHEDGSHGPAQYMEDDTDGTEGHPYLTFTEADKALSAHPDKFADVHIQVPMGIRVQKVAVAA